MPRFFPSFHRSRDRARDEYTHYENYPQYDARESQSSAWRRVVPGRHDSGSEVLSTILTIKCPDCDM